MAALKPSDQKLAICLESIQVMQILHEMPLPNARHSRILNEAALGMGNRQNADMLLKVSNSLAPKAFTPDAAIPELPESMPHRATSPRCRHVSIMRLLCVTVAMAVGVAVAVAVLPLRTFPSADSTRLHQQTTRTRRIQGLKAVAGPCGCLMLDALSSLSQSPIISKHLLPPPRRVSVGGLSLAAMWLWPYKNGGASPTCEGPDQIGQVEMRHGIAVWETQWRSAIRTFSNIIESFLAQQWMHVLNSFLAQVFLQLPILVSLR